MTMVLSIVRKLPSAAVRNVGASKAVLWEVVQDNLSACSTTCTVMGMTGAKANRSIFDAGHVYPNGVCMCSL
jgi:hypothetical protein